MLPRLCLFAALAVVPAASAQNAFAAFEDGSSRIVKQVQSMHFPPACGLDILFCSFACAAHKAFALERDFQRRKSPATSH